MKLYRFCSHNELQQLMAGKTIHNSTDHYRNGEGGSISRGFCLTQDKPEEAWKYLKGIVTPDVCIRFDIDRQLLTASSGKYATNHKHHPDGSTTFTSVIKREWCIDTLRPEWLTEVIALESFVPEYELDAARYVDQIKTILTSAKNDNRRI